VVRGVSPAPLLPQSQLAYPANGMRMKIALIRVVGVGLSLACSGTPEAGSADNSASGAAAAVGGRSAGGRPSSGGPGTGGRSDTGGHPGTGTGGGTVSACTIFPPENPWNQDVSGLPVHPNSDAYISSIGEDANVHPDFGTEWEGAPIGIPYVTVSGDANSVEIEYTAYGEESDPGPFPIPLDAPIEGGPDSDGDRHAIALDLENCKLYELYRAFPVDGHFEADSGVEWDLTRNDSHPPGCTSADAAGLPIFPGLVRYDEVVEQGAIHHALRFTVSRSQRAYVAPATHYASSNTDPSLPPMGLRVRMKAGYDCSGYSDEARVVCDALKKYGMILADNGSNWYISGAPDARFSDANIGDLKQIPGSAFEAVDTGAALVTDSPDCSL
jgi:hypothetical protein